MKRLYTEAESIRIIGVVPIAIVVLIIFERILFFCMFGASRFFLQSIMKPIIGCLIWESIILIAWYPREYKLKRAMKRGKEYIGKIKSIDKHKRTKFNPFNNYIYTITVKTSINGTLDTLIVGDFSKDPGKYFQINDKCKVYRYKNKLYTQLLYSKRLSDEDRKNNVKANYRDSYLIIPRIKFSYADNRDIIKRLDAIITICAPVTYDSRYFPLYERISQYLENVEKVYSQADERLVRDEVKQLITNIISERAYDAEIESIQINIKTDKKRSNSIENT